MSNMHRRESEGLDNIPDEDEVEPSGEPLPEHDDERLIGGDLGQFSGLGDDEDASAFG